MCGRYALYETPRKLSEYFELSGGQECAPSWNIAPSARICAIAADAEGKRHLIRMRWGMIPSWAKDASIGNRLTNARGETVSEKPSFKSSFKRRRCIIPASGFFEWQSLRGVKQPWFVSLRSGEPMALAGLWDTWRCAEGTTMAEQEGETVTTCCIITTAANALMEPIHDRMPVILYPEQWETWLSLQVHEADKLLPLLRSHEPESMQAWAVSRDVNRVGLRDDAGLVEKVAN
jgi:putative SOS response-associated peptidase YedK